MLKALYSCGTDMNNMDLANEIMRWCGWFTPRLVLPGTMSSVNSIVEETNQFFLCLLLQYLT